MVRIHSPSVADRTGWCTQRRAGALIGLLVLATVAVNLWWTGRDRSLMPVGDSYVYLTNLLRFIDGVSDGTLDSFSAAMRTLSFGGRPPVYQLLTVPFVLIFGRTENAALMVNGLFIAVLICCTYRLGSMLRGPAAGVLAAFLVVSYPPVVNLSRLYLPYIALPAVAALSLWLLLLLVRDRSVPVAWGFGASLGLGLLMHPNFLWFAAPTALLVGSYLLLFQYWDQPPSPSGPRSFPARLGRCLSDRFVVFGLIPGAVIAIVMSVPWYLIYGRYLLSLLKKVSSSEALAIRGTIVRSFGFPDMDPGFWWYLLTAPGALSWFFAVLGLVGLGAAVLAGGRLGRVLAAAIVATGLVLSSGKILVWWYPPMVLPALAALTAGWIVGLKWRWLSMALFVLCTVVASFNYAVVTWGVAPGLAGVARLLGAPLGSATCASRFNVAFCPAPSDPRSEDWPVTEVIEAIQDDPECRRTTCQLMVTRVGDLSLARFTYYVVRDWPGLRLDISGEAARVWGKSYNLRSLLESDYIFFPDGWIPRRSGMYKLATIRLLQSPPPLFSNAHQEVVTVEGPGGRAATLLKRVEELTSREAIETIAALDLKERFLSERYNLLSRLYIAESDLEGMKALLAEANRNQVEAKTIEMVGRRLERLSKTIKRSTKGSVMKSDSLVPAGGREGSLKSSSAGNHSTFEAYGRDL